MCSKARRVRNWSHYNKRLVKRGAITLWLDEGAFQVEAHPRKRGRAYSYSDKLIEMGLVLKNRFHLDFRGLEGFLGSLFALLGRNARVPNYTTLCRRQAGLSVDLGVRSLGEALDIVVDSTGLKLYGAGEWCVKKHGKTYQRSWRKIHLGIDAGSLQIRSCELSGSRVQDSTCFPALLSPIREPIAQVIGDGAYDTFACYEHVTQRGAVALFPPRAGARLSLDTPYHRKGVSEQAIRARDSTLEQVQRLGKAQWKKQSGYHQRSLAETTMYRLKQLLGDRIRAKKWEYQQLEVKLRCHILNKMINITETTRLCT